MHAHAKKHSLFVPVLLLLTLFCSFVRAEEPETRRPRIGLALSGGGARGIAHIGILRTLEQMRIPVDYIAGTSMGAVIGGLYASGMELDEIEKEVLKADWNALMNDRTRHRDLSFRQKKAAGQSLCQIEMGIRNRKIVLPEGLVTGRKMAFMLDSLTLPVTGIRDFDKLPIPFRAVATDISDGSTVVFSSGRLSSAIRASMAIPGVFAPIEDGNRLLVDGGISCNLPVSIVREMGADIVIAVDISTQPRTKDNIKTMMDISRQVISLMVNNNVAEEIAKMKPCDILIRPRLENIKNSDFKKAYAIIEDGYNAGRENKSRLSELSLTQEQYQNSQKQRIHKKDRTLRIDYLNLPSSSRVHPSRIQHLVRSSPDTDLNLELLKDDIARLYAVGEFEEINFDYIPGDDWSGLNINTQDKSWGRHYLQFGLETTSDLEGSNYFNVRARQRTTCINSLGAEWQTDIQAGNTRIFKSEFYQPLTYSGLFFLAPFVEARHEPAPVFEGKQRTALYSLETIGAGIEGGISLGRCIELSAKLQTRHIENNVNIGDKLLPEYHTRDCSVTFSADIDKLDNFNFPRHGTKISANLASSRKSYGSQIEYDRFDAGFLQAVSHGPNTLVLAADVGSALGSDLPFHALFRRGGFLNLSGLRIDQKSGPYSGSGKIVFYRQLAKLPPVAGDGIYVGVSLEAGNVWDEEIDMSDLIIGGSLFAGFDTIIGPFYIAYGRAEENNDAVYIYLGRPI